MISAAISGRSRSSISPLPAPLALSLGRLLEACGALLFGRAGVGHVEVAEARAKLRGVRAGGGLSGRPCADHFVAPAHGLRRPGAGSAPKEVRELGSQTPAGPSSVSP